jgi:hypothetical protein
MKAMRREELNGKFHFGNKRIEDDNISDVCGCQFGRLGSFTLICGPAPQSLAMHRDGKRNLKIPHGRRPTVSETNACRPDYSMWEEMESYPSREARLECCRLIESSLARSK